MDTGDKMDNNDIVLNDLVASFLRIVELGWPELKALHEGHESDDGLTHNWLQAQWEIILEQSLKLRGTRCSLLIYGNGAETETSRVFDPDAVETHAVCCRPKSGLMLKDHLGGQPVHFPPGGYALDEFVALSTNGHGNEHPYDGVMLNYCALTRQ